MQDSAPVASDTSRATEPHSRFTSAGAPHNQTADGQRVALGALNTSIDVSLIMVNRNTSDLLRNALISMKQATRHVAYEELIVDNASTDSSVAMVRDSFPGAQVIVNDHNQGFARANNQGFAQAHGRYFLLLNTDTIVHDNAVDLMVHYMDAHPEVGVVGPHLHHADGSTQVSIIPFRRLHHDVLLIWGVVDWPLLGGIARRFVARRNTEAAAQSGPVDALMGACLLLRRKALEEVGVFDDDYFFTWEEIDLCWRLQEKGWLRVYLAEAEVTHFGGQSWKLLSTGQTAWMYEGRLRYYAKNHPRLQFTALRAATAAAAVVRLVPLRIAGKTQPDDMKTWRTVLRLALRPASWFTRSQSR